jgi:hypothetical protein
MPDEKRYQVFVSSTSEDLKAERQRVWETLVSLEYIVSGMEAFPATNDSQFEYIKQQIQQSDYYILIIAGRYGSMADQSLSFTEREFDFAQELGIPSLVFPIRDINSVALAKTDQNQTKLEKLQAFRTKASKNRLCHYWETADELSLGIVKALQTAIKANPRTGWQRGGATDTAEVLSELRRLRNDNDKLRAASRATMVEEIPNDLRRQLKQTITFTYFEKEKGDYFSTQLSLRAILVEMSIFEKPTFDLFEESLRGAIARETGKNYDNLDVDRSETDRLILSLAKASLVQIRRTQLGLAMRHGDLWIAAHSDAKLD